MARQRNKGGKANKANNNTAATKKNNNNKKGKDGDEKKGSNSAPEFKCPTEGCGKILRTPSADEMRGRLVKVRCTACESDSFLQYHCWACATPLRGIDYNKSGVQGQCPECKAYNPAKKPRVKDSCDDASNRCIDRIMFGFTAFIQPYCVYAQTMWIYPYVLESMGARGSTLEKVLYAITLFVSAGTLFNYWAGVFTPIKHHKVPHRSELKLLSKPETANLLSVEKCHFCDACRAPRGPRDHHCNICKTCVPYMDHHCPFYGGSCVGRHNHRNFILFLLFMMSTTTWLATSTVACFAHLPAFPKWIFQREFSKKIMQECRGKSPFCPMMYIWGHEDVSMFGVVFIQLLLTILTLILVSILFQQQVSDLMQSRTRLEGIIAKSKEKKKKAAEKDGAATQSKQDGSEDSAKTAALDKTNVPVDGEAAKWGELRDVCGPGRSLLAWIFVPKVGTLKSSMYLKKKREL